MDNVDVGEALTFGVVLTTRGEQAGGGEEGRHEAATPIATTRARRHTTKTRADVGESKREDSAVATAILSWHEIETTTK